jgi:hypothetical protein
MIWVLIFRQTKAYSQKEWAFYLLRLTPNILRFTTKRTEHACMPKLFRAQAGSRFKEETDARDCTD